MKSREETISEFNELVNMTADELEAWLKSDESNSAGWPKHEGEEEGETVGHDSGRKIVDILRENPDKEDEKYSDDQVAHMRKVVSYCKRHLAQETKSNNDKSAEDVKETKSYASLKNWGHDFLKAQGRESNEKKQESDKNKKEETKQTSTTTKTPTKSKRNSVASNTSPTRRTTRSQTQAKAQDAPQADEEDEHDDDDHDVEKSEKSPAKAGSKRKQPAPPSKDQEPSKKQQTSQGKAKTETNGNSKTKKDEENNGEKSNDNNDDDDDGSEAKSGPKKGDTVSWNWGGGQPEGKVLDVKGEDASITTKNGNTVTRKGNPDDPAVIIDAGKSKAIKSSHELN